MHRPRSLISVSTCPATLAISPPSVYTERQRWCKARYFDGSGTTADLSLIIGSERHTERLLRPNPRCCCRTPISLCWVLVRNDGRRYAKPIQRWFLWAHERSTRASSLSFVESIKAEIIQSRFGNSSRRDRIKNVSCLTLVQR